MIPHSTALTTERARLEERLALIDLLIAISDESVASQHILGGNPGLEGEALAEALTKLTIVEASGELRRTDRKRVLEALLDLDRQERDRE